jgi:hypothetical protein
MCRCRRSRDVDVEAANDVAVVEVDMLDVVLVVVGVAAITDFFLDGAAVVEEAHCGCQRVHSGVSCRCHRTWS